MHDATSAKGFRRISSGIRPKSAPARRSQNRSQSLSQLPVCNPRSKGLVSPETTATFEDAGTAERHGSCEMPCEAFAHLPRGHDKELKCGVARLCLLELKTPLGRRDRCTACLPAWRAFPPHLRSTDEWSSKHPRMSREHGEMAKPGTTHHSAAFGRYCPLGQPQLVSW
jgi:hypothetical protein